MNNSIFEARLNQFRGDEILDAPSQLRGGEGQLFLSEKTPNLALKRWFSSRLSDMDKSVNMLKDVGAEIRTIPGLSNKIDVVKVHEQGKDWILRDFDPDSIPLKQALKDPSVAAQHQQVLDSLANAKTDMLQLVNKRIQRIPPSANMHWSPTQQKIIIIDMM